MNTGIYLFLLSFCIGGSAWFFFAWAVSDGQFKENEDLNNMVLDVENKYS